MPEKNQYQYGSCDSDQCSNRILMIGPFLLSMGDQWHIVMTENPLFLMPNGHCGRIYHSITTPLIHCEFMKCYSVYHQFPVHDHLSSTSHKLLSRMTGRGIVCQCLHLNTHSYLWRTEKEAQVEMCLQKNILCIVCHDD